MVIGKQLRYNAPGVVGWIIGQRPIGITNNIDRLVKQGLGHSNRGESGICRSAFL